MRPRILFERKKDRLLCAPELRAGAGRGAPLLDRVGPVLDAHGFGRILPARDVAGGARAARRATLERHFEPGWGPRASLGRDADPTTTSAAMRASASSTASTRASPLEPATRTPPDRDTRVAAGARASRRSPRPAVASGTGGGSSRSPQPALPAAARRPAPMKPAPTTGRGPARARRATQVSSSVRRPDAGEQRRAGRQRGVGVAIASPSKRPLSA